MDDLMNIFHEYKLQRVKHYKLFENSPCRIKRSPVPTKNK